MINLRNVLYIAAVVALSGSGLRASTLSYSGTLINLGANPTSNPNNPSTTWVLEMPLFNSSYGTLTGVKLYFRESLSVTGLTFQNLDTDNAQNFDFAIEANLTKTFVNSVSTSTTFSRFLNESIVLFDTGLSSLAGSCTDQGLSVGDNSLPVLPGNCTPVTIGAGATVSAKMGATYSGGSMIGGTDISAVNTYDVNNVDSVYSGMRNGATVSNMSQNGNLAALSRSFSTSGGASQQTEVAKYIGAGNFTFTGTNQFSTNIITNSANLAATVTSNRSIWAQVDYTYTAIATPEPGTMGLMGGALLGAILLRKRIKR